jgi:paired small multidrug resistance pump
VGWIYLVLGGCFEVVGVMGVNQINRKRSWRSIFLLVGGFGLSFLLLAMAMRTISMGTAYAVWTGIGTVGSALVGMFIYGESKEWSRIFFIGLVLAAAVGLKLIS